MPLTCRSSDPLRRGRAFEALAHREENLPLVLSLSLGSLAFDACHSLCTRLAATTAFSVTECHDYMEQQRQVCLYASETQQERINVAFQMLGLRKSLPLTVLRLLGVSLTRQALRQAA